MMSDGRTLHRADVMHACYSVSAIAMKAQKASWHYRQSLTPAPATQAPRRAVRKAQQYDHARESRRTRTLHHRRWRRPFKKTAWWCLWLPSRCQKGSRVVGTSNSDWGMWRSKAWIQGRANPDSCGASFDAGQAKL